MAIFRFNSFLRFLGQHKTYTFIEVFGLSVSLMFVILILTYSRQELTTDRFHADAERIYMLGNEEHNMSAYGIAERVKERYPEIEDYCYVTGSILVAAEEMPVLIEGKKWNSSVSFVNDNFFRFFSFPLLQGNKEHVMAQKNDAVISESYARKVFGGEDPVGKVLTLNDSISFVVNGVMKDIRHSVIKYNDVLVRTENLRRFRGDMDGDTFNNALCTNIFLKEQVGSSLASTAEDMCTYFKGLYWFYEREIVKTVEFIPITEAYYSPHFGYMYNKGDKQLVLILLTVGLLILIFAVINYINLTVAQTGFRAKEMATRSLLGSSRATLFTRLIGESTFLTFLSFLIGIFLAFAALPYAERILDTTIDLYDMFTLLNLLLALVAIVLIGFITGLLPALLISRTKAVDVVKGGFRKKTKMVFSRFFITFQNAITIALMAAALVMITQVNHLIHAPLGYETKNIIDIPTDAIGSRERISTLVKEFRSLSTVSLVSSPAGTPFSGGNNNTIEFEGRSIGFQVILADSAFVEMLGIEILHENHVASSEAYYLSEYALKEENLPFDATTFTYYKPDVLVAGVMKDFALGNILREKQPVLMQILKEGDYYPWNILVQVQGDPYEAYQQVKNIYEEYTGVPFTGRFVDKQIEDSFIAQRRVSQIITLFSGIAILLSLLGLLAMSTYFIQQRSREIGVRKVFGSNNAQILKRLV
ncbi:ABC transporter permease, partial [Parabacteroides sp. OttesenSCG-928-O15]|nr:ABC transporter permease [Parabacteroides sp. OttesenSCG-928-O15]